MTLALISDIHGNRLALEAVLADIDAKGITRIVNLGDCLSGPMDPRGTADLLRERNLPTVIGNHDRYLRDGTADGLKPVDRFVFDQLAAPHRAWLASLPATLALDDDIFLCHGTPASDETPWLDSWWTGRTVTTPTEDEVARHALGVDFAVIACGHTHQARAVRLSDGRMIVNPGAVGLQVHMGLPDARYATLDKQGEIFAVRFHAVPYDAEGAARQAAQNGFPQWRKALTTGWVDAAGLF